MTPNSNLNAPIPLKSILSTKSFPIFEGQLTKKAVLPGHGGATRNCMFAEACASTENGRERERERERNRKREAGKESKGTQREKQTMNEVEMNSYKKGYT